MAYFCLTVEPDHERRALFLRRALESARSLGLSEIRTLQRGDFAAVLGAPFASVLDLHEGRNEVAFLLGYALDLNRVPLDASSLSAHWRDDPGVQPDGFFAAAAWSESDGLTVGVDPLGCIPCAYASPSVGSLVCASTPGDLQAHPQFQSELDLEGVAGVLLLNNPLFDRSTLRDARLLPVRARLRFDASGPKLHRAPLPEPGPVGSFDDAVEELTTLWEDALTAHSRVVDAGCDLLLSGGRDSRMVAAGLKQLDCDFRAVTFGRKGEHEYRAARRASRALRIRDHLLVADSSNESSLAGWWTRARRSVAIAGGTCADLHGSAALQPWLHHGILVDDLVGGLASGFCRDRATQEVGGHVFFRKLNRWGFPAETLARLFRDPAIGDYCHELRDRVLTDFSERAEEPEKVAFDWKLATRMRFHLGYGLFELARYSWPITPACDQRLIAAARRLPLSLTTGRRIQHEILRRYSPRLLRIPFDGNTRKFLPESRAWLWPHWRQNLFAAPQPLRYHRILDPESEAWRRIRQEAERGREALSVFLDPKVLEELWPVFPVPLRGRNQFAEMAGARSLMMLASWLAADSHT
jgi:hypothetical protein